MGKTKHFQSSDDFIKLREISHANWDLKVLDTFMFMHIHSLYTLGSSIKIANIQTIKKSYLDMLVFYFNKI